MAAEMVPMEDSLKLVWGAMKDRAQYMALVVQELDARGLDTDDIVGTAIRRAGVGIGEKSGVSKAADEYVKTQTYSRHRMGIFKTQRGEMTPERAVVYCHYCPLVDAWRGMGLSDKQVVRMCDLFENRDEGRMEAQGLTLEVPQTIARGDPVCEFVFSPK